MSDLDLLSPGRINGFDTKNRIIMAPMTRSRALPGGVPSELAIEYYAQRATAGLIITEGTAPSAGGLGYARTPAIETAEQVAAWKKITDAVHGTGVNSHTFISFTNAIQQTYAIARALAQAEGAAESVLGESLDSFLQRLDNGSVLEATPPPLAPVRSG